MQEVPMGMSLRRQAMVLTLANAYTRVIGFALRLLLARGMSPEALGVMEMTGSVTMLALTPVTAGVPVAVSRLSAQGGPRNAAAVLKAGRQVVARMSLLLAPGLLLLSPLIAWLLGDFRTLPAIWTSVPMIFLLGQCAVYSGLCYGLNCARLPAMAECGEQTLRVMLIFLWLMLPAQPTAISAAMPGVAEGLAALFVLTAFSRHFRHLKTADAPDGALMGDIRRLSGPMTASRMCLTGMRALNAVLLPMCLRRSGLSANGAAAQFGMLSGMAMPLTMLPGVVTGALCMVSSPMVARQEHQPEKVRATCRRLMRLALMISLPCGAAMLLGADFLEKVVYRADGLAPLIRLLAPLTVLAALMQVLSGVVTGLGLQRRTLTGTLACSALTLVLTAWLCPLPAWGLRGAAVATLAGHALRLVWTLAVVKRALHAPQTSTEHIFKKGEFPS